MTLDELREQMARAIGTNPWDAGEPNDEWEKWLPLSDAALSVAMEATGLSREDLEGLMAKRAALKAHGGRKGLCDTLSDEQLARLREYDGPEIAGRWPDRGR